MVISKHQSHLGGLNIEPYTATAEIEEHIAFWIKFNLAMDQVDWEDAVGNTRREECIPNLQVQ